ncbi:MAG: phosphatase PAP2 family protein [Candidatus Nanopelagicales bacterium]
MDAGAGSHAGKRLAWTSLVCVAAMFVAYALFVGTRFGHQVDAYAYFGRDLALHRVVRFDSGILGAVTKGTLALLVIMVLIVALIRRIPLVGLFAVAGVSVAIVGAELLKLILPWHPLVPLDSLYTGGLVNGSFPSGHTTIGTSVPLAFVLVSSARWRPWLAAIAGLISASYATGVVFAGWHRPSDAIGGVLWATGCLSLAAWLAWSARGQSAPLRDQAPRREPLMLSLVLAVMVLTVALAGALVDPDDLPNLDASFVVTVSLIVSAAFGLTAWFGQSLRTIDWVEASESAVAVQEVQPELRRNPGDTSGTPRPS